MGNTPFTGIIKGMFLFLVFKHLFSGHHCCALILSKAKGLSSPSCSLFIFLKVNVTIQLPLVLSSCFSQVSQLELRVIHLDSVSLFKHKYLILLPTFVP
jgi:hypothetical protein